jgi:hypothetical protein
MRLTPGRAREFVISLVILCLVILVAIGVAVWWIA